MIVVNADLPAFSSVEEVAVWAMYTLQQHNVGLKIVETELGSEFFATTGVFTTPSGQDRLLLRATIPLKAAWVTDAAPRIWKRVDMQSNVAIQSGYKTNV